MCTSGALYSRWNYPESFDFSCRGRKVWYSNTLLLLHLGLLAAWSTCSSLPAGTSVPFFTHFIHPSTPYLIVGFFPGPALAPRQMSLCTWLWLCWPSCSVAPWSKQPPDRHLPFTQVSFTHFPRLTPNMTWLISSGHSQPLPLLGRLGVGWGTGLQEEQCSGARTVSLL